MFSGDDTVLVVGAHPDDEVLGAGGTMAKHADSGDHVYVLIVTEGSTQQYDDADIIEQKRRDAKACGDRLGVEKMYFGDLPDMRLDDVAHVEVNQVIEGVVEEIMPNIVYTHSRREVNRDHVAVHGSTLVATRPGSGVTTVAAYETPSSTEYAPSTDGFHPELYVDITRYIDDKIEGFKEYTTEVREYPHPRSPRSLRALAESRGAASEMQMAEAFDILRMDR